MGYNSTLYCELRCPSCDAKFFDRFCFCWGKSSELYRSPGEKIRWAKRIDGSILPHFTLYGDAEVINMGFPEITDLFVSEQYYMEPEYGPYSCEKCDEKYATAIAEIRSGMIQQPVLLPWAERQKYGDETGIVPVAFRFPNDRAVRIYDVNALLSHEHEKNPGS